jgi:hypothetical protein
VAAGLEAQPAVDALALDAQHQFLVAAQFASLSLRTSVRQPWRSHQRRYMRARSPANSADSSPPVPARISRKALRSSSGSRGISAACSFGVQPRHVGAGADDLLARHLGHLGVGIACARRQVALALLVAAEAGDDAAHSACSRDRLR